MKAKSEWHPIETVPQDTSVLVCDADGNYFVAVYQSEPYPHWRGREWLTPTHWMPLPELPRADGLKDTKS